MIKFVFFLLVLSVPGCDFIPSDPEKSYEKARSEGLIVGYTSNHPWIVEEDGDIGGIEGQMIKSFAELNNMQIFWVKGTEQESDSNSIYTNNGS